MAIKITFDAIGNPQVPTMILAKRNGDKMGALDPRGVVVKDNLNASSEIQFEVYKYKEDGKTLSNLWFSIINFRLIWCKEWDTWFELTYELDEQTETVKTIYCTQLGEAELGQIGLYDIQINTEDDIARDDYEIPTVFYNPEHPEASLLNRMMEHAPHYHIGYVDETLMNIQRTFTFDGESIYDGFMDVAEEIGCLFVFPSNSNEDGTINREINVYDLYSNCNTCGYRGDYTGTCPECGSSDIDEGYGDDTTIFVAAEELANEIQFGTDTDSVKNCFKLEGGDDLMTATIRNCNPNGSDRIWYFSSEAQADMSDELKQRLSDYNDLYDYYQNDYVVESITEDMIETYNELVTKYRVYNEDIEYMPSQIIGYPQIMEAYYNTLDFAIYLQSGLMPDASMNDTSAEQEADKLTAKEFGDVAVADVSNLSTASANNAVLAMAKVIVDSRYQVKVNEGDFGAGQKWTGNFKVTNYSDDEDTALSNTITLTITDDYEEYLRQMIEKEINSEDVNDYSINALFKMDYDDFCEELKKYCLDSLSIFWDAGQACLDILIEQGIADKETWGSDAAGADSNLYEKLYLPYYEKQAAIEAEMKLREDEIISITGSFDEYGLVETYGMQVYLYDERCEIQAALNFEDYLGDDLLLEFSAFRREDKYDNSNYISDGLNNAELFARAWEFLETAYNEIYKSGEFQHSISSSLKDLLVMDKFAPLIDYFECGNWLRIRVDGSIYKLRLIGFEIDFDNIEKLSVDFSDVMKTLDGLSDKQSLISQATSMASSYDYVRHQATQGSKASGTIDGWSLWGLDVDNVKLVQSADNETQSWDSHGMLFKQYDPITETYSDEQLKIIHSTMVITDDNWETVRTAVGGFYYYDPANDYQLTYAYGVNGEAIVGQLILGEQLGIYNSSGTLKFDSNGLSVTNGTNTFTVNPNSDQLLVLSKGDTNLFYVDSSGNAAFTGRIEASSGHIGNWIIGTNKIYNDLDVYDRTAVMQAPHDGMTWVFACGGESHDSYSDCLFRVSKDGKLFAQDLTSGDDEELKATIKNGLIEFYLENVLTGCITTNHLTYSGSSYLGTSICAETDSDFISIGTKDGSTSTSVHSKIIISNGFSFSGYEEEVLIFGTSRFIYDTHFSTHKLYFGSTDQYYLRFESPGIGSSGWLFGDVGVGAGSSYYSSYTLSVDGDGYASGRFYEGSDLVLKTDVRPIESDSILDNIEPVEYKMVDDEEHKIHFGVTYQNICDALEASGFDPEQSAIVSKAINGRTGEETGAVAYDELIGLLIYEVKELKAEIEKIKST